MTRQWLWASIPIALIGLIILPFMISRLLDLVRTATLVTAPIEIEQVIYIDATGPMLLHGEGPRFTTAFADLKFQLTDAKNNQMVPLESIFLKASSSGISRSRLSLRSFVIEQPGDYRLNISGLNDSSKTEDCLIAITRDHRGNLFGTIVALVFSSIALMAGTIISLIAYFRSS